MASPYRLNNRVSLIDKYELSVKSFLGVDRSTSKFAVDSSRAIEELNYVYKNGTIQKREGIEEMLNILAPKYRKMDFDGTKGTADKTASSLRMNGLWVFKGKDGNRHLIAHVGCLLYELNRSGGVWTYSLIVQEHDSSSNIDYCYEIEDFKSSAFIGDSRLWLLGGNQILVISNDGSGTKAQPISKIAYVPTTTISITYLDSDHSGRELLDSVNMITPMRKNMLTSDTIDDPSKTIRTERFYSYQLDSDISFGNGNSTEDISVLLNYMKEA